MRRYLDRLSLSHTFPYWVIYNLTQVKYFGTIKLDVYRLRIL